MRYIILAYLFWLGAIFASFSSVLYDRGAKSQAFTGRSKCVCGKLIPVYYNIPIIGYLVLNGYSKCCGSKIPRHLFWNEVILATTTLALSFISIYLSLFFIAVFTFLFYIAGVIKSKKI